MGAKLMLSDKAQRELESLSGSPVLMDEPMSLHTTFRLGGPADIFTAPADAESFAACIRWAHANAIEHLVLGAGSNLLVADAGIRGLVLATTSLKRWSIDGDTLVAESGVFMPALSKALVDEGFSGFVEACGIPGSIGGGLHMNAGAYGWNISKVTKRVIAVNAAGEGLELDCEQMEFGPKTSALMKQGYIALSMHAHIEKADKDAMRAKASELLKDRASKQPLELPNAGCIFRNPTGAGAGRLIRFLRT